MSTRTPGRRRRPALVAGAVATIAAASVAGSLVTGATAAPTPARSTAPAGSASPADENGTGMTARTRDGKLVPVVGNEAGRLRPSAASSPGAAGSADAAAGRAATTPKAPAFTALGRTGLVVSASPLLAFAPDGSRVAWSSGRTVYSARANGSGRITVAGSGLTLLAWSPGGRFISGGASGGNAMVFSAALRQGVEVPNRIATAKAFSWLTDSTVVAQVDGDTFVVSEMFGNGGVRRYQPASDREVVDATAAPDGTRVAVRTRSATGNPGQQIVVVDAKTLKDVATVVTTTGTLGRPAWSADSATVYVPRTQDGTTSIVAHPAGTADGDPTVVLADAARTPYVYLRPAGVGAAKGVRVTGRDAITVSVVRSRDAFRVSRASSCKVRGGATSAVLAAAGSVEATVAAPLAAHTCGPALLTGARSLDSRTATELKRLLSRGRTVYLVGNTRSLSPSVATAVARLGFKVVRYGGADVYATSVVVATKGFKDHKVAAIASATQPLAAAAAAASTNGSVPLLLTKGTAMPKVTDAYIDKYDVAAWVVGTQGAKAAPWAYKYVGSNDAATALKLATVGYYPPYAVGLVSGTDVSLVYAAAADATLRGYPLLVVAPRSLGATNRTYVNSVSASVEVITLFGSTRQVATSVLTDAVAQAGGRIFR